MVTLTDADRDDQGAEFGAAVIPAMMPDRFRLAEITADGIDRCRIDQGRPVTATPI